jgi:hypothetical protein
MPSSHFIVLSSLLFVGDDEEENISNCSPYIRSPYALLNVSTGVGIAR